MTQAVTHFLVAAILVNLFRDYVVKNKHDFPLHLVLIAGIAGLLPDFDVAAFWILHYSGLTLAEVHRTFTHNLFVPLLFLVFGIILWGSKNHYLESKHIKLRNLFFVIAFGVFIHLVLDATVSGLIMPFYPLSTFAVGLNIINFLPVHFHSAFLPSLDAVLLMFWMIYLGMKHKISSYI